VTSNVNVYGLKNFPTLGEETTATNFFVVKIVYGVDNRDHVYVYRNPASLVDESGDDVFADTAFTSVKHLGGRSRGAIDLLFDL
jgi:hypothetical protein